MPEVGRTVAHYQVLEKLGEGGMGVVYKARDTHLNRSVALKVLPPDKVADPERKQRFIREAQAASALNHPNIVHIYDIDEQEGLDYIAMEYVPGQMLGEAIGRKGLQLREALKYGIQIAEALSRAHAAGIIHRDLKPSNIMVDEHGLVKVLDFGLAKLTETPPLGADDPTQRVAATTEAGTIVGTVAYMSPEQAEGKKLDARSDIFSFGSLLYEMVAGRRAFPGESKVTTLAAIIHKEPAPLGADVPPDLQKVIARCLRKDPARRFQGMADVRVALEELQDDSASGKLAPAGPIPRTRRRWLWATIALLVVLLALFAGLGVGGLRDRLLTSFAGSHGTAPATIRWLAVLPVKNLSGDASQEYFADAMTDALINGLGEIKAVQVKSLTSAMHYKGTTETAPQIAQELGVDGIVEASVTRPGGRIGITVRLVDARRDRQLWRYSDERDIKEVVALQSEVVQAIASGIGAQLAPQESKRLGAARPVDPEVYDLTVKGKATLEYAMREEQFHQAIELFQKAVDRDPTYAPAWAGLGDSLWSTASAGMEFVAPKEVRARAIAAAEKALELDEKLPEAHKARAVVAWDGEWDIAKAKQHFERALELRPGYAAAEYLYAQIFILLQRFDDARRHMERAADLDPLSPWNDFDRIAWWIYQGRAEEAIQEVESARRRNPTVPHFASWAGYARIILGQPDRAAAEAETALKLFSPNRPGSYLGVLGCWCGMAGRRDDALKILSEMEQLSRRQYISPLALAEVNAGLGRMDEAFRLLEQALEERTPYLGVCIRSDPSAVALRRDPRWKPFIERVRKAVRLPPGTPDPYQ